MVESAKQPVRKRRAIMIRPDPDLLELMEKAAAKEGLSLNRLALDIIESSGRFGAEKAVGDRAELNDALIAVEASVRRLRASIQ